MKRVLVFPSRNEPGLEIIRSLAKSNKLVVVGGSSDPLEFDPSRLLLARHLLIPHLQQPNFRPEFAALLGEHEIDIVFPTVDSLVADLAGWSLNGVDFVTPSAEVATLLLSKRATYQRLAARVAVPQIVDGEASYFPLFAKPDVGSGSRGTMVIDDDAQLEVARSRGLLVTEYLAGDEYTVDCVSDLEGNLLESNPRLRGLVGRGISLGTRAAPEAGLSDAAEAIADELRITGPWFAQFKRAADGTPKLLEVNARVAGSMAYTRLSGVNIPLMVVFMYAGHQVRVPPLDGTGVMNRTLANLVEQESFDSVVWDFDDTLIRKDGKPDPDAMACLYDLANRGVRQFLLSKRPDVREMVDQQLIPNHFEEILYREDKVAGLEALARERQIDLDRCVLVNDSYSEAFALRERFAGLRIVTPDALERLGREPVQ